MNWTKKSETELRCDIDSDTRLYVSACSTMVGHWHVFVETRTADGLGLTASRIVETKDEAIALAEHAIERLRAL